MKDGKDGKEQLEVVQYVLCATARREPVRKSRQDVEAQLIGGNDPRYIG